MIQVTSVGMLRGVFRPSSACFEGGHSHVGEAGHSPAGEAGHSPPGEAGHSPVGEAGHSPYLDTCYR